MNLDEKWYVSFDINPMKPEHCDPWGHTYWTNIQKKNYIIIIIKETAK